MNNTYIPFTYRIGWSHLNKYYYGSKYNNDIYIIGKTHRELGFWSEKL